MSQITVTNLSATVEPFMSFFENGLLQNSVFRLNDISFTLSSGKMMALLGPNGAGKTTLLKALMGLVRVTKGKIIVGDHDITRVPTSQRLAYLGLTFQLVNQQFHALTVFKELWHVVKVRYPRLAKKDYRSMLSSVITQFSLGHVLEVNPHVLSGGEKRRLSLAILTLLNPSFYLFDEPTMGLDAPARKDFHSFLMNVLSSRKHGIIMATHDLEFLLPFNPLVLMLEQGHTSFVGPLSELLLSKPPKLLVTVLNVPHWVLLLTCFVKKGLMDRGEFLRSLDDRNVGLRVIEQVIDGN